METHLMIIMWDFRTISLVTAHSSTSASISWEQANTKTPYTEYLLKDQSEEPNVIEDN